MNILIIDDEPLIANTVCRQLREPGDGDCYDVAFGTEEARRLLKEKEYEIFLCDIVMPVEDGIAFARWVLGERPDSKIIFLTAHADYKYMKEAISLQSFDYILQPVEKEELRSAVERAKKQVVLERRYRELVQTGAFFRDKEMDILEHNAIRYLRGESDDEVYLRRLLEKQLGDRGTRDCFLLADVQILRTAHRWKEEDRALLRGIYSNIVEELLGALGTQIVLALHSSVEDGFLIFLPFDSGCEPELAVVKNELETLRYLFEKLLKTEAAVYLGDYCGYQELRRMCGRLDEAQKNNVRESSQVICVGDAEHRVAFGYSFERQLASWKTLLKENRLLDFRDSLQKYLSDYSRNRRMDQDFMMKLHQAVSELVFGYLSANGIKSSEVFDETLSYYDFMYCYQHVSEFNRAMEYVMQKLRGRVEVPDENLIHNIIRYVHQNLDQELTVQSIARLVGLNEEYLSRSFKKSTGISLKRYISGEKMEAAKVLLATTELSVTVISERVGYGNYSNFARSFRQLVGCTPSDYRRDGDAAAQDRAGPPPAL